MEKFVVWTKVHDEEFADERDYKIEAVLWWPTQTELDNLPKEFSWLKNIWHTDYQNGWGSCVAMWGDHTIQIQNIEELRGILPEMVVEINKMIADGENLINLDRKDLWIKMGHDINNKNDSWDYIEKMLRALRVLGIKGKTYPSWEDKRYLADGDAFRKAEATEEWIAILKHDIKKYPVVMVIKWNQKTRQEMEQWRLQTVMYAKDRKWAHCVLAGWYDTWDLNVLNSRTPNDENWYISSFKIDWHTYKQMVSAWMINWRYWQVFDKKDSIVDLERYNRSQQAKVFLAEAKKFYMKWDDEDKKYMEKIKIGEHLKKYGL